MTLPLPEIQPPYAPHLSIGELKLASGEAIAVFADVNILTNTRPRPGELESWCEGRIWGPSSRRHDVELRTDYGTILDLQIQRLIIEADHFEAEFLGLQLRQPG